MMFCAMPKDQNLSRLRGQTVNVYPKTLNISSNVETKSHKKCIIYRLKINPAPERNVCQLKNNVKQFSRKLWLIEYFPSENNNSSSDTGSIVKSKSSFVPPDKRNKHLDATINYLKSQNYDPKTEKRKTNISKAERNAMKELLDDMRGDNEYVPLRKYGKVSS